MPSYYECYYDHEDDRELWCGMLAHTPFLRGSALFAYLRLLQKARL